MQVVGSTPIVWATMFAGAPANLYKNERHADQWVEGADETYGHSASRYKLPMLSSASVNVSEAVVEIPKRRKPTMKNWGDPEMKGWNDYHDALMAKIKEEK